MSKGDGAGVSSQMCGPRPTGTEAVGSMTAIRGAGVAEWGLGGGSGGWDINDMKPLTP